MSRKIIAFCGETFFQNAIKDVYVAKPTSAAFLQDTFGKDSIFVCSPVLDKIFITNFSTEVSSEHFYAFPHYDSTKSFMYRSITEKGFYNGFVKACDDIVQKHQDDIFWIRTPSIGSIIFGLRVLKAKEELLHHMCADASNTWKDAKYSGVNKLLAFLTSRLIRFLLKKICSNPNTTNFCTGDVLENFSRQYSAQTHQFVDLMTKHVDASTFVRLDKSDNRRNLLFVGRIVEDKGVFDLIEVVKELKDHYSLTIVGDGPDLERAKTKVSQLQLQDSICFTGQLPHSELSTIFYQTDLVVVPSNNNYEGFPRVIMEAWSFNKPVVVSNVGGINAFVKHGENGFIMVPGDRSDLKKQLINCLDPNLYKKIKSGASEMIEKSKQEYWCNILRTVIGEK
jgi:glycosyltransferase involved in cell wall biosynthesis